MRLIRLLIAYFVNAVRAFFATDEVRTFLPQEFMEKVLREVPDCLYVSAVGPSMIAVFSYYAPTGDGTIYRTSVYPDDGLMPSVYRALLHEGAKNDGVIKDPFKILAKNDGALTEYLGAGRVRACTDIRRRTELDEHFNEA